MELSCTVQMYDWGKIGSNSKVAKLMKQANSEFEIEEDVPYAELWMGTHVSGPSIIKQTNEPLATVIQRNPHYLGESVLKIFGKQLPFLFKVLSINKALSIQAHPSKKHAEFLHQEFPQIYKDSNHKPEMAIALTPFEALCGFRPYSEIFKFMEIIPELKTIALKDTDCSSTISEEHLIQKAFRSVLTCEKTILTERLDHLLNRLRNSNEENRKLQLASLFERLYDQFPNDVGCFMVYFLNYLKLNPLEAIYLEANMPHAYLSGDCIECMACSDNVVRAGLTPKLIDVETLCSMLNYKGEDSIEKLYKPGEEIKFCKAFYPPIPDFAVALYNIPIKQENYELPIRNSASILITIEGKAETEQSHILVAGKVFFIPSEEKFVIVNITENLLMFQAFANV